MVEASKIYWDRYIYLIKQPENQPKTITDEMIYEKLESWWVENYKFPRYTTYESFRVCKSNHFKKHR